MSNVKELLEKFCYENDDVLKQNWKQYIFQSGNKAIATNGWVLITVPLFDKSLPDFSEKLKNIYPVIHNKMEVIEVATLKAMLDAFPKVDCYDEISTKCDACNGFGNVTFEFNHGKTYELDGDCPVCNGAAITTKKSATPNGKKELDYNKLFKIGVCAFNAARIEEIIFVANFLEQKHITLVRQTTGNQLCMFRIGEAEMLVMPSLCEDDETIAQELKLQNT